MQKKFELQQQLEGRGTRSTAMEILRQLTGATLEEILEAASILENDTTITINFTTKGINDYYRRVQEKALFNDKLETPEEYDIHPEENPNDSYSLYTQAKIGLEMDFRRDVLQRELFLNHYVATQTLYYIEKSMLENSNQRAEYTRGILTRREVTRIRRSAKNLPQQLRILLA